jgi:hypothetical protein
MTPKADASRTDASKSSSRTSQTDVAFSRDEKMAKECSSRKGDGPRPVTFAIERKRSEKKISRFARNDKILSLRA